MTAFAIILRMYQNDYTLAQEVCSEMKHGEADLNAVFAICVKCAEQRQCEMNDNKQ